MAGWSLCCVVVQKLVVGRSLYQAAVTKNLVGYSFAEADFSVYLTDVGTVLSSGSSDLAAGRKRSYYLDPLDIFAQVPSVLRLMQ